MNTRVARQRRSRPTKYLKFELPLKYLTSLASLRGPGSTRSPFNPSPRCFRPRCPFPNRVLPPPPPARERDSRKRETALESSPFARLKGRRPETVDDNDDEDDDTWFLGGEQRGEDQGQLRRVSRGTLASISGWVYRGLGTRLRRVSWLLSSFKAGIVIRSFMTAFELPNPAPEMEKLVLFEGIRISFNCFASTRLHFFFFWIRFCCRILIIFVVWWKLIFLRTCYILIFGSFILKTNLVPIWTV